MVAKYKQQIEFVAEMKATPAGHHQTVNDPEILARAIPGTRLAPCQLDPVHAPSRLSRYQMSESCLDIAHLGPRMAFEGETAQDSYTLIFVTCCPGPGQAFNFGVEHGAGYLGVFPPGAVIDAMTPPGYGNAMLTIQGKAFMNRLESLYPGVPGSVLSAGAALRPSTSACHAFQSGLVAATDGTRAFDSESPEDFGPGLEAEVLADFIQLFADGCEQRRPTSAPRLQKRYQRLRQTREFIEAHLHQHLPIESVCHATGLSQRGLELLFQDLLDVTPTTYIRQLRLQKARQKLLCTAYQAGMVKKIAFECGFSHLGRFAHDYHRLFGESPGATLRR